MTETIKSGYVEPPVGAGPALLFVSCKAYSDLWEPLCGAIRTFWPDCQYDQYLATDDVPEPMPNIEPWALLRTGAGGWSANLHAALTAIKARHSHVFIWLDDLFPVGPVLNARLQDLANYAAQHGWSYVRFASGLPPPRVDVPRFGAGKLPPGDQYRNSVVMSMWKVAHLIDLLHPAETAWQFETRGASRSDRYSEFFSSKELMVNWVNGVIKGKWDPRALRKLIAAGIVSEEDAKRGRPVMSRSEIARQRGREIRSRLFLFVPRRWRRILHLALTDY